MTEPSTADLWMNPTDRIMYGIEHNPRLRMSSSGYMMLDQTPDGARLRDLVDRMSRLVPRFRQVIVAPPPSAGPPRFVSDPDFDLNYHFREIGAPGDGSVRSLLDYIACEHTNSYDSSRPPWMFTLITGLRDGPSTCLYMRIHHAVTDGVGGLEMMGALLSTDPDIRPNDPLPEAPAAMGRPSGLRLIWEANLQQRQAEAKFIAGAVRLGVDTLRNPMHMVKQATAMSRSLARGYKPDTALSPLLQGRSRSLRIDEFQLPLDELKAASKTVGGKLNDAFLAGVARGLSQDHRKHGLDAPGAVRLQMIINQRPDSDSAGGNDWAPARIVLSLNSGDAHEALVCARDESARARGEPAIDAMGVVAGLATRLPLPILSTIYRMQSEASDGAVSNLPGIPVEVYVAGAAVQRYVAIGPIGGTAFNITALSYENQINLSVQTDPAAIEDPETFVDCLRQGFSEVLDLTTDRRATDAPRVGSDVGDALGDGG